MRQRRLLIGTPMHDGRCDAYYTHALIATARLCMQAGIDMRELFITGDSIIQNARNDLVKAALEKDFDDLIFIDSDQTWQPEWVLKLLAYPVDCVGAAVRKKTDAQELYNVKTSGGPHSFITHLTGLLTSSDMALGCGFIKFSRRALQLLWDTSEPYHVWGAEESRWIFDIRPVHGELVGEDTMVSDKLRALGIQTYLDPSMTCGHIGAKKWEGDFAVWLDRLKKETLKPMAA